ncbi:MAG: hypothetical protein M3O22_06965, partial [Pseudomonadota bacterium]|nr:hypothetical protein [Pseudomonadota bacterium]
ITEKSVMDHAVSIAMDEDCNMMKRSEREGNYCVDWNYKRKPEVVEAPVTVASTMDAPFPVISDLAPGSAALPHHGTLTPGEYHLVATGSGAGTSAPEKTVSSADGSFDGSRWKPLNLPRAGTSAQER